MASIGAAEAARELDLSPRRVRQMLAAGHLRGERIGRDWVMERSDLDGVRRIQGRPGRPWNARSAWALLAVASGDGARLSPLERSRARKRLQESGIEALLARLSSRASIQAFYAHPGVLDRLEDEPGVVRSGASAVVDHKIDLIVVDQVEAYVRDSQIDDLIDQYRLDPKADRPNVVLRVVDDDVWPFGSDDLVAAWPVVAVDLLEAADERSRRAGHELLARP